MNSKLLIIATLSLTLSLNSESVWAASVKGKLKAATPSQYKILAVGKNGQSAVRSVSTSGKFSVNAKTGMTLHIIGSDNRYVGPIVAPKGSKAYTALSGKKGSFGKVTLKTSFASVPYGNVSNLINKKPALSFNKTTGPKGAGKLGLVLAPISSSSLSISALTQIGQDDDKDGLPNLLDVDDDGDLILDVSDPVTGTTPDYGVEITSTLRTTLVGAVNKNISGLADSEIDSALSEGLILGFTFRKNTATTSLSAVNIDCGTLAYCQTGSGTATIRSDNLGELEGDPWISYDPDSDGLPNVYLDESLNYIGVKPRASRSEIRPGDTLYFKATTSAGAVTIPAVLPFYFVTAPTLKEYSSGIQSGTISYPVTSGNAGTTVGNPFVLGASTVTLSFYKPQRPAIQGAEEGDYIDNGKLNYGVYVSVAGDSNVYTCLPSEYSSPSTGLEISSESSGTVEALTDTATDSAVSSSNVLSFTLDLGTCLSRQSVPTSGTIVNIDLNATSVGRDQTSQSFYMQLP